MEDHEFDSFEAKCLAEDFGMLAACEDEEEPRDIEVIETEILWYKQQAGTAILEIGARLIEAKAQLSHGEWERWLTDKVDFSVRSAQRFMKLAEGYSKSDTVTLLGTRKALALLALEESEREDFLSVPHDVNGEEKMAADMTAAELEQAIRERDEARRAAEEAQAAAKAAETARTKMEADMRLAKNRVDDLDRQAKQAQQRAERLYAELTELKNRPVEVAVQVDEAALAKARAEGEQAGAKAREKALAELRKELEAAEETKRTVEARAQKSRERLEALQAELGVPGGPERPVGERRSGGASEPPRLRGGERYEARDDAARKPSAADPDFIEFNVYIRAAQESLNKAYGVELRTRNAGKTELAGKMGQARQAVAEGQRR